MRLAICCKWNSFKPPENQYLLISGVRYLTPLTESLVVYTYDHSMELRCAIAASLSMRTMY